MPEIRRKRKLSLFILMAIPVMVGLLISIYFLFHKDLRLYPVPEEPYQRETLSILETPVIVKTDTIPQLQMEQVSGNKDTIPPVSRSNMYFTIGGSFKSAQNANKYYVKMVSRGYHPVHLGLIGNFYLVALDSFKTAGAAYNSANRHMDAHPGADIWIYHRNE